jgi:hypothetical protein
MLLVEMFDQPLLEYAWINPDVIAHFEKNGYQRLDKGEGVDKAVFAYPTDPAKVIILVGTQETRDPKAADNIGGRSKPWQGESNVHRMMQNWIDLCQKYSGNPFLPKYGFWKQFKFSGDSYMYITGERLYPLDDHAAKALDKLSQAVQGARMHNQGMSLVLWNFLRDMGVKILTSASLEEAMQKAQETFDDAVPGVDIMSCITVIQFMVDLANEKKYGFDLHGDNFMQRADGSIVVNDPWTTSDHHPLV